MTSRTRSIAMLAANPAFAAILGRSLEQEGGHQVASFAGIEALTTFLRISPVDLVVLDTDLPGAPAIDIARGLRTHLRLASTEFSIVALTRTPEPFHKPLLAAGIDAVLVKPVVPVDLIACVDSLFAPRRAVAMAQQASARPLVHAAAPARIGNVIPLFGEGRAPRA